MPDDVVVSRFLGQQSCPCAPAHWYRLLRELLVCLLQEKNGCLFDDFLQPLVADSIMTRALLYARHSERDVGKQVRWTSSVG